MPNALTAPDVGTAITPTSRRMRPHERILEVARELFCRDGIHGTGIERILTAAIEQSNDAEGFGLPRTIAPFDVIVTLTNTKDSTLVSAGEDVARRLEAAGFDVLLDDRDERAGVKFKDADLIGVPYRVNVGKKVSEGKVEVVTRATRQSVDVGITEVVGAIA